MNEGAADDLRIDADRSASPEGPVTLETGKHPLSRESRFRAMAEEERAGIPLEGGKGVDGVGQGDQQAPPQFSLL